LGCSFVGISIVGISVGSSMGILGFKLHYIYPELPRTQVYVATLSSDVGTCGTSVGTSGITVTTSS
jgi:hypothetical protein